MSWASGLTEGITAAGKRHETREARKASTRMEERKKYMDQINISTSFFSNKAAHNDAKLEEYLGPYSDAVEKITGKKPVALTSWGPNIPEYTKRLNDILKDDSLTRKQKFVSARALEAEAKGDPQVAGMVSVGIEEEKREGKLAHENNKNQAIQLMVEFRHNKARVEPGSVEAKELAKDFYNKLKKIKDIDPRAVGAATEELKIILSRDGEEATTIPYEREKPPQAGVPSAKDFTLGSLDKYGETGKYGDLKRMPEKVTPPKTPTKIQVAMRAAGIPTETPIGEMSEDDAVKVLVKLKEYGGTQGDFFSFLDEKAKYHRGSGFTGFLHRVLDYFTSGGYGEEDEKVLKSVLDK
jgi:hypothetical protein